MYVAENKTTIKGRSYTSILLMESYRSARGPRRRTLANLSKLPADLVELIRSYCRKDPVGKLNDVQVISSRDFAGLAVVDHYWRKLGLDEVLSRAGDKVLKRLKAMIWQRIFEPSSKRRFKHWAEDVALDCFIDLPAKQRHENRLYEAMDGLIGKWVGIEKTLYGKDRGHPPQLLLYDLTSSYFDGVKVKRARFGYSRDHRGDRRQILIAIVKDERGVPLTVQLLKGNRADVTTVSGQIIRLKKRFGIERGIYVGDQGTVSEANLKFLTQRQRFDYVVCLKRQSIEPLLQEAGEPIQLGLFDEKGWQSFDWEGKRYVLCHGPQRAERDRKRRQARLGKGREKLEKLRGQVKRGRLKNEQKIIERATRIVTDTKSSPYFQYWIEQGEFDFAEQEKKIRAEQALDGKYLLECSRTDVEPEEIINDYKDLRLVEKAFEVMKSDLGFRPVYHWKDRRVQAHLYINFLSYWLETQIELDWRAKGFHEGVCPTLRRLNGIRLQQIRLDPLPMPIYRLSNWEPERDKIVQQLGLVQVIEQAIPVSQ